MSLLCCCTVSCQTKNLQEPAQERKGFAKPKPGVSGAPLPWATSLTKATSTALAIMRQRGTLPFLERACWKLTGAGRDVTCPALRRFVTRVNTKRAPTKHAAHHGVGNQVENCGKFSAALPRGCMALMSLAASSKATLIVVRRGFCRQVVRRLD